MKTTSHCFRIHWLLLGAFLFGAIPVRAATFVWNAGGAGPNDWATIANWTPSTGMPGALDTAVFGDVGTVTDAFTVNNLVNGNTTVSALNFYNTNAGQWHVTQVPAGVTLVVTNMSVGLGAAAPGSGARSLAALFDGGALAVYGSLSVGNAGTGATTGTTLDLAGLNTFVHNSVAGTLTVGTGNRSAANLNLAGVSNHITAATLNLNVSSSSSSVSGSVNLGAGTNIIHAGAWNQAAGRNTCTVRFPAGAAGGLRVRGVGGTDADLAAMTLGNHNNSGGSGSTANGTLSLEGGIVDMRLSTLILGRNQNGTATGPDTGSGTLSFDTGTVYASAIAMAITTTTNGNSVANGTVNVGANAALVVGTGGISMASLVGGTASGNLNITGGTLTCSNSIIKSTVGGTATLNVQGGRVQMVAGTIGSAAAPIDTFQISDSRVSLAVAQNVTNIVVATLMAGSATSNVIDVTILPVILSFPVQYTLISFQSGWSDFQLGSLPPGYQGSLINNPNSVDLVISSGPVTIRPLVWNGAPNGDWNTTTPNWWYQANPTAFAQGDYVTFDDSATGTTTVNLTGMMTPGVMVVSNMTKAYSFGGSGGLGGAWTLVKAGAAMLTLENSGANTFSNGVSILDGTLRLSGSPDRLPTSAVVTLADAVGAGLDLNNLDQTIQSLNGGGTTGGNVSLGSATLTAVGGGNFGGMISGSGRLIKTNLTTGGTLTLSNANTYTGGTLVGGYTNNTTLVVANPTGSGAGSGFVRVLTNGTFAIGNGGAAGSVAASVIDNDGTVRLNRSDEWVLNNLIQGAGSVLVAGSGTAILPAANPYSGGTTINPGILRLGHSGALGSGPVVVQNSAATLQLSNSVSLANPLTVASKPSAVGPVAGVENLAGSNVLTGPLSLTANGTFGWVFSASAGHLRVSSPMTVLSAAQTSQNTSRILWLRGDSNGEWAGNIVDTVNAVTNVALRKDGSGTWTLSGANTFSGPAVLSNGTLVVSGSISATSTLTVQGGVLSGSGTILRPVTVNGDGTLAPGTSIGTLAISNTLALAGTTIMEVSHTAWDKVVGITDLALGGTLRILVNGTLQGGEVFKLFSAANLTGDFAVYDLPTLPSPLGWDFASLPVDGTLKVTGGLPVLEVSRSGNTLTFQWASSGFKLQAQTNSLSSGLGANWVDYPGGGTSPVNVPISPANPTVFFRLVSQ